MSQSNSVAPDVNPSAASALASEAKNRTSTLEPQFYCALALPLSNADLKSRVAGLAILVPPISAAEDLDSDKPLEPAAVTDNMGSESTSVELNDKVQRLNALLAQEGQQPQLSLGALPQHKAVTHTQPVERTGKPQLLLCQLPAHAQVSPSFLWQQKIDPYNLRHGLTTVEFLQASDYCLQPRSAQDVLISFALRHYTVLNAMALQNYRLPNVLTRFNYVLDIKTALFTCVYFGQRQDLWQSVARNTWRNLTRAAEALDFDFGQVNLENPASPAGQAYQADQEGQAAPVPALDSTGGAAERAPVQFQPRRRVAALSYVYLHLWHIEPKIMAFLQHSWAQRLKFVASHQYMVSLDEKDQLCLLRVLGYDLKLRLLKAISSNGHEIKLVVVNLDLAPLLAPTSILTPSRQQALGFDLQFEMQRLDQADLQALGIEQWPPQQDSESEFYKELSDIKAGMTSLGVDLSQEDSEAETDAAEEEEEEEVAVDATAKPKRKRVSKKTSSKVDAADATTAETTAKVTKARKSKKSAVLEPESDAASAPAPKRKRSSKKAADAAASAAAAAASAELLPAEGLLIPEAQDTSAASDKPKSTRRKSAAKAEEPKKDAKATKAAKATSTAAKAKGKKTKSQPEQATSNEESLLEQKGEKSFPELIDSIRHELKSFDPKSPEAQEPETTEEPASSLLEQDKKQKSEEEFSNLTDSLRSALQSFEPESSAANEAEVVPATDDTTTQVAAVSSDDVTETVVPSVEQGEAQLNDATFSSLMDSLILASKGVEANEAIAHDQETATNDGATAALAAPAPAPAMADDSVSAEASDIAPVAPEEPADFAESTAAPAALAETAPADGAENALTSETVMAIDPAVQAEAAPVATAAEAAPVATAAAVAAPEAVSAVAAAPVRAHVDEQALLSAEGQHKLYSVVDRMAAAANVVDYAAQAAAEIAAQNIPVSSNEICSQAQGVFKLQELPFYHRYWLTVAAGHVDTWWELHELLADESLGAAETNDSDASPVSKGQLASAKVLALLQEQLQYQGAWGAQALCYLYENLRMQMDEESRRRYEQYAHRLQKAHAAGISAEIDRLYGNLAEKDVFGQRLLERIAAVLLS